MLRYLALVLFGTLTVANAQADDDRNRGQVVSDCNHQANERSLKGQDRKDFVDWCTATAQRFNNNAKDVGRYSGRYDSCADAARRLGYKGDERQRYMDWCVDRQPEQASASYWDAYRDCYARATDRGHENADRRDYIERCLEGGRTGDSDLWQSYQQCFETADDRRLSGDDREDFVNRCVGRGDERAYNDAVARSRTCSDRADDRDLTGEKRRDYIRQCMGSRRYSFAD